MSLRILLAIIPIVIPATLDAQGAVYARSAGDTIRLHEVTTSEMKLRTPQGEIPFTSLHDAVVAVTFLPGDSARAWYETLTLESRTPQGVQRPETAPALNRSFTLGFDARGRVLTLATPEFPAAFQAITDLRHQFADFFLRLPAERLRTGMAWVDTVTLGDSAANGRYSHSEAIARYRVEGDTVIGKERGVVITMRQTLRIRSGGPLDGQQARVESSMEGTDEGVFIFSTSAGRILGRVRTGRLSGTTLFRGPQGTNGIPQTLTYRNTLTPVER